MYKPELLKDLLITIQSLKKELPGSDAEKIKVAQEAYHDQAYVKVDNEGDRSLPYMNWKLPTRI
jgi:hypothetical protein